MLLPRNACTIKTGAGLRNHMQRKSCHGMLLKKLYNGNTDMPLLIPGSSEKYSSGFAVACRSLGGECPLVSRTITVFAASENGAVVGASVQPLIPAGRSSCVSRCILTDRNPASARHSFSGSSTYRRSGASRLEVGRNIRYQLAFYQRQGFRSQPLTGTFSYITT